MKEKKKSNDLMIAITHLLTSGIIIVFAAPIILSILIKLFLLNGEIPYYEFVMTLMRLLGIWWGVFYSAGFLAKKYTITDSNNIVQLSTIYFWVLYLLAVFILFKGWNAQIFDFWLAILYTTVFYFLSKKYIANS